MGSNLNHPLALDLLSIAFGLVVGSFLNVVALRSLSGQSIVWPPSHCMRCQKRIPVWDNIPLVSFLLLKGRCRFCRAPISWQYPAVELGTAAAFFVVIRAFGVSWQAAGMLFFVCTLIAVTVTDLREKLIPHDITYPSMLVGLAYSTFYRHDPLGALAGVGASYIIFDFLAHYGLKLYLHLHGAPAAAAEEEGADEVVDQELGLSTAGGESGEPPGPEVEVMGGGDAVLSAVIAAYLGWQRLVAALVVGFVAGTIFGVGLLIMEMHRAGILKDALRPTVTGVLVGFVLLAMPALFIGMSAGLPAGSLPWIGFGLVGAAGGALLGIVSVGTRVSKPFPFGPALAIGGAVAVFWDPISSLAGGGA